MRPGADFVHLTEGHDLQHSPLGVGAIDGDPRSMSPLLSPQVDPTPKDPVGLAAVSPASFDALSPRSAYVPNDTQIRR